MPRLGRCAGTWRPKAERPEPAETAVGAGVVLVSPLAFGFSSAAGTTVPRTRSPKVQIQTLNVARLDSCMDDVVDVAELLQEGFQIGQWHLVGAV